MDTFRSSPAIDVPILGAWIWQVDVDRVTAWPSLASLLCLNSDTLRRGVSLSQFLSAVHPADRDRIDAATALLTAQKTAIDQTFRVITAGMGVRSVHLQGAFHSDEGGRPHLMTGVVRETTNLLKPPDAMIVEHLIEARKYAVAAKKPVLSKLIEATLYEAGLELASALRNTFVDRLDQ